MKRILLAALLLPFFAFKCKKESGDGFLRGKIIRISCADMVIQVLNDNTIGEDGWQDIIHNNAVYNNVFTIANQCFVLPGEPGDIIRFKITDQPEPVNCIVAKCALADKPPVASYYIKEVTKE